MIIQELEVYLLTLDLEINMKTTREFERAREKFRLFIELKRLGLTDIQIIKACNLSNSRREGYLMEIHKLNTDRNR